MWVWVGYELQGGRQGVEGVEGSKGGGLCGERGRRGGGRGAGRTCPTGLAVKKLTLTLTLTLPLTRVDLPDGYGREED